LLEISAQNVGRKRHVAGKKPLVKSDLVINKIKIIIKEEYGDNFLSEGGLKGINID
jgi:predicted nucleic acid-binding protein